MTDRSQIIRHPDVVHAEFQSIARSLQTIMFKLNELTIQLEQVAGINREMWPSE